MEIIIIKERERERQIDDEAEEKAINASSQKKEVLRRTKEEEELSDRIAVHDGILQYGIEREYPRQYKVETGSGNSPVRGVLLYQDILTT